jgi:hypothetical protein
LEKLNYTMSQVKASNILKEQAVEAAKELVAKFGQGTRRISFQSVPEAEQFPAASEATAAA